MSGLLETVALALTQLAAFLIFIWLLKHFAMQPVLRLLDDRREKIASEFNQIAVSEKRISALKEEYEDRLRKIDEEARKRSTEEVNRGRRIAEEIVENARQEAAAIVEKARAKLQLEVDQARVRLKEEIVHLTLDATERLLGEELDEAKHHHLVRSFVDDLERQS
jgi:F-type H+-transporting ATPase subunit b